MPRLKSFCIIALAMKIFLRLFGLISFVVMLTVLSYRQVLAKDFLMGSTKTKQSEFESIKIKANGLVEENKKLEVQYSLLQNEYVRLVEQIKENKNVINGLQHEAGVAVVQPLRAHDGNPDVGQIQNNTLVTKSRVNLLKTHLANLEESANVHELHLAHAHNQRADLEIGLKMKNFNIRESQKRGGKDMDQEKTELQQLLQQEQEAVERIAKIQEEQFGYPKHVEELKIQNKELQDRVSDLEKQADFKRRENANLRDKRLLEQMLSERAFSSREEEKAKSESQLKNLEAEYNRLDQQVSASLENKDKGEQALKDMIRVDKENQDLRDRIRALKEKINELEAK